MRAQQSRQCVARRSLGCLQAMDLEGDVVFRPACKMGLEGDCLETAGIALQIRTLVGLVGIKDLNAPAVKREPEEDWGPVMCREREL